MRNDEPTPSAADPQASSPLGGLGAAAAGQPVGHLAAPEASPSSGAAPKQVRLLLAGVALAALVALLWPRSSGGPPPGGLLRDAAGAPRPLAEQLAPVTLLHFWSTWCPPCVEEAPAIARLAHDFGGERRFTVLMVAVADEAAKVRAFDGVTAEGVLYDPEWEVANRYGTEQLPETYLLVDGRVRRKWTGAADWDDPQVRAVIQRAIAAVPAGG